MKRVLLQIVSGIFAIGSVAISAYLFWNTLVYADTVGVSTTAIYGSPLNFCLNWLQMFLMIIVAVISFANIGNGRKKNRGSRRKDREETPAKEEPAPQDFSRTAAAGSAGTSALFTQGTAADRSADSAAEAAAPAAETAEETGRKRRLFRRRDETSETAPSGGTASGAKSEDSSGSSGSGDIPYMPSSFDGPSDPDRKS